MGLGLLGRGLGYTKFLAECGAQLIVTDMKTKEQLASSVKELKKYKNIEWVLGEHRMQDFKGVDMVIKNPGIPADSIYIKEARKNKIPVEMDASLFAKLAPEVTIVGITGTRGKSMTTMLVYEILKGAKKRVYLGGNIRGIATLPLLAKMKKGDIVVMELDSWQCAGFGDAKISPHISIFTTFMRDHMNYYGGSMKKYFADKANIFKYQKKGDILIILPEMKKLIPKSIHGKLIVVNSKKVSDMDFTIPGTHQLANLACAVEACKALGVSDTIIKKAVKNFKGVEGRLQYMKTVKGVKIYNDNNATTPEATVAGLEALSPNRQDLLGSIILICGGADKKLDTKSLVDAINKYTKAVVLLPGSGTEKLIKNYELRITNVMAKDLKDAVGKAMKSASKGDTILFSPAFASFGMFTNEYDRNDQFVNIIKGLK